jgi:pimeloyl-ACP methyl ester carboxylesterase
MFGPILPVLAERHQVVTVDLQGHGRTADIDRSIDVRLMAGDIAALIDHLGLVKPDIVGYSLGGGVALQTAVQYPAKLRRLVVASANIRPDAIYPEMRAQQGQVNAAAADFMKETPMYQLYQRVAPHPEDFPRLLTKIGEAMSKDFDSPRTSASSRCRRSSSLPTPTWRRPATTSRCSNCLGAASKTAAGWARAGRRAATRSRSSRA